MQKPLLTGLAGLTGLAERPPGPATAALARWCSSWWPTAAGLPGAAALLMLALAAALAGVAAPAWQAEAQAQQLQARQAARQAALRQRAAALAITAAAQAPGTAVPVATPVPERVADLLALAQRHGVHVQRLAQKPVAQAGADSVQLLFNAQGTYADLRRLAEAALLQDPALSLDRLAWRRATAADAVLEAELQWSLWLAVPVGQASPSPHRLPAPWPQPPLPVQAAWGLPPPPPPPPPQPAVAAAPTPVPKFPYTWIGRLDEAQGIGEGAGEPPAGLQPAAPRGPNAGRQPGRTTALLAGPQRSVGVRAGDVLDGRWRVDRITPTALHLTWLPTGQTLNLSTR